MRKVVIKTEEVASPIGNATSMIVENQSDDVMHWSPFPNSDAHFRLNTGERMVVDYDVYIHCTGYNENIAVVGLM